MSIKKVFLATKGNITIGAVCSVRENVASKFTAEHKTEQVGLAGTREVALASLVKAMKLFKASDFKDLERPIEIFVNDSLANIIDKETYKYWLISGKKSDGNDVEASELALWQEFYKLISKNGMYFIFKNLNSAHFKGNPKYNALDVKYNAFYYDWVWKQVHAILPKGPALPEDVA